LFLQVGPERPRKTPATPPPTPHSLFLNGIDQHASRGVGWNPATRRKHDVTASRKNRQDHRIWLVSVPTTPNFDAAYLHAHWVHANNETGFEQVDPNLLGPPNPRHATHFAGQSCNFSSFCRIKFVKTQCESARREIFSGPGGVWGEMEFEMESRAPAEKSRAPKVGHHSGRSAARHPPTARPRRVCRCLQRRSPCTIARVRGAFGARGQWISAKILATSPQ